MTRKLGLPLMAGLLLAAGFAPAHAADDSLSVAGPGTVEAFFTDGDFATDAGAGSSLAGSRLNVESHLDLPNLTDATLRSFASAFLSAAGPVFDAVSPPPIREFLVDPLLADATFSRSELGITAGSFGAFSETWKGGDSGDSESVTSAETVDSHTLAASGLAAVGTTNQSVSQAILAPADGDPLFSSAAAESSNGGSSYAMSAIGAQQGLIDNDPANPPSPFLSQVAVSVGAFEGNGIAHVDALAGHVYAENEISDEFDGATLTGVAESISSILTPNADIDSVVEVAGDGSTVNRSVLITADLTSAAELVGGTISSNSISSNSIVFDQTLTDNTVIESGPTRTATIADAGQNIEGLVNVNQDVGNSNNQANIRSLAISDQPNSVLLNDVTGKVSTTGNTVVTNGSSRSDVITDNSFAGSSGIVGVNQSSGSINQLTNVLALAVGIGDNAVSIGDVSLEAEHSDNTLVEDPDNLGSREERIDGGAFNGFNGIAQVNQVAGDLNQVSSVVTVSVSVQ